MTVPAPAPLRLGIAGLGTVGIGVVKIIQAHADLIAARSGRPIRITAICARDRHRNRDADLSMYEWEDCARDLARRDDVDVFVELIGGDEGIAREASLVLSCRRAAELAPGWDAGWQTARKSQAVTA